MPLNLTHRPESAVVHSRPCWPTKNPDNGLRSLQFNYARLSHPVVRPLGQTHGADAQGSSRYPPHSKSPASPRKEVCHALCFLAHAPTGLRSHLPPPKAGAAVAHSRPGSRVFARGSHSAFFAPLIRGGKKSYVPPVVPEVSRLFWRWAFFLFVSFAKGQNKKTKKSYPTASVGYLVTLQHLVTLI